ncbi:MAG: hypothetical protein QME81_05790 [bacterium]|nr:hypothetical protein [bacterium]
MIIAKENAAFVVKEYISEIHQLYSEISSWLEGEQLTIQEEEIEINEEAPGRYNAPRLLIRDPRGNQIADIKPIGAWIIGAKGGIDIVGLLDKEAVVYMEESPQFFTTISVGGEEIEERSSKPLFRGVERPGWYWIEDKRRSKAHLLDKELFLDLLTEVSDYEFH